MKKILIIDDDPDVRTVMDRLMRKHGYDVETASRREEAIEKIGDYKPSLIVLDVLLSGSDGREICREIKASSEFRHIPVLMVSAHPGAADNYTDYGADDFITKPIRTEVLFQKLEALTDK